MAYPESSIEQSPLFSHLSSPLANSFFVFSLLWGEVVYFPLPVMYLARSKYFEQICKDVDKHYEEK